MQVTLPTRMRTAAAIPAACLLFLAAHGAAPSEALPEPSSLPRRPFEELRLELGGETLVSRDVLIGDVTASARWRETDWDLELLATRADISLDYQNAAFVDPLGFATDLRAARHALQMTLRSRPSRSWTVHASGGGYLGYTDYRSLWLNEYYRQRFEPLVGYETAHPAGWNGSTGARWEVRPAQVFLQCDLVYQLDRVAPAYEKLPFKPLIRRQDELDTYGIRLAGEAILSRTLRGMLEAQMLWTTEREARTSVRASVNWAATEFWVVHFTAGATVERPEYLSGSAEVLAERHWNSGWFAGLGVRYYKDNGQLNQSLPESTASPGLTTLQSTVVVRWQGESWGFKASVGPYLNAYEEVDSPLNPFIHLYRDRSWVAAQLSVSRTF